MIERGDEVADGERRGVVGVVARMSRDTEGSISCWVEWLDGSAGWFRLREVGNRVIVHKVLPDGKEG